VQKIVTYTTRPPRPNEEHGKDYHFVSQEEFQELIKQGAFLEHKEVFGNQYGTPLPLIEQALREGKFAVLKIDVQGAMEAMKLRPDALTIFLLPPTQEELERRICSRATDSPASIQRRLAHSKWELQQAPKYQYQIVNREIEGVVKELDQILGGSRRRAKGQGIK
jgi:guanylate kinase